MVDPKLRRCEADKEVHTLFKQKEAQLEPWQLVYIWSR